ncbi:hypothetical protein JW921_08130 [Candidatus Fermentibacterales bacterium]|nr:hypothetical protein [Candidatus Fermentibacterales bacterium]
MTNRYPLRQRAQYRLDNLITRSPFSQILALAMLSALIVIVGTLVIALAPGERMGLEPGQDNLFYRLWWCFTRLMDPGTFVEDTGSALIGLTGILVTMGGILVFSLLIGILSSKIGEKLDELKQGKSPVIEEGHTIILGSGEKLPSVVRELVEANANQPRAVVAILSDVEKDSMETGLQDRIADFGTTFVVCRTGVATDIDELRKVNIADASSLIILASDDQDSDVNTIKTLLAVGNLGAGRKAPLRVVCEINDTRFGPIAEAAYPGLKWIPAREIVVRLMVQIARQNGLSAVYSEMLSFSGNEIYIIESSEATGMSFGEIVHRVVGGIAIGIAGASGIELNPAAGRLLQAGDRLVVLTEDDDTCRVDPGLEVRLPEGLRQRKEERREPERTLVLGINRDVPFMLRQLDCYVSPGSTATVAAHLPAGEAAALLPEPRELENLALEYRQANRTSVTELEALEPLGYDNIVVLSRQGSDLSSEAADAECIVCLLILRQLREKEPGRANWSSIVSEIRDPRNKKLATVARANDFIVSNEIVSMILAQISEEPSLAEVYAELFDPEGCEIYLRSATVYVEPGSATSFARIMQIALSRGEVAIGYRRAAYQMDLERSFGVALNPSRDEPLELAENDSIIVIARE